MPSTIPMRVRLTPAVLELLKAAAKTRRWSVAGAAAILLEEKLLDEQQAAAAPVVHAPTMSRDADVPIVMRLINKAMQDEQVKANGERVALATLQEAFCAERSDRAPSTNRYKYFAAMKVLIEQGASAAVTAGHGSNHAREPSV